MQDGVTSGPPRVSQARRAQENDALSWYILAAALLFSGLFHAASIIRMPDHAPMVARQKPIEMEMRIIEPPPPPPPPPEPPKPEPEKPKPPPPVKVAVVKPPPTPPPSSEPPPEPPKAPPPVVIGMNLSNTNAEGSFAAPVGNTAYGKAADTAVDPNSVKPYVAPVVYAAAGSADTEPVRLGEETIPYPEEAKKAEIEGQVTLKVTIDDKGSVVSVVVMGGPGYGLNEAARDALKRFRFKPATKGGQPVGYTFLYKYSFWLD